MRYFVESYGCTMNFGEGRSLSEDMASLGHQPVDSADEADIVVLNTCTVVETTEKRMLARISELKRQGKEVIVTGCMAKVQPKRISIRLPDSPIVPFEEYDRFPDIVRERYGCAGAPVHVATGTDAILPIAQGCLGRCSYCITKFARGDLRSYPAEDLLRRFDGFLAGGAREILITAQDTSSYGHDTGTDVVALLGSMLGREGDYRIRLGMTNPDSLAKVADGLVRLMDDDRLYRFVHIPVQSGSDSVLRGMRRRYTVEGFLELVDTLRSAVPDISIATDLICGFPGETDEDHRKSVDLIRELRADTVNITRFSSRPGTDAASMEQVHGRVSAERSAELTKVKNETELDVNRSMVGRSYRASWTSRSPTAGPRTSWDVWQTELYAEHLTALTQSRGVVVNHAGLWSQRLRFEPGRDYHHLLEPRKSSTGSRYLSSTKLPPFIMASNTGSSLGSNPLSFIMTHTASKTALSNGFSLFLSIHPRM